MSDTEPLLFRTVLGNLRPRATANIIAKAADRFWVRVHRRGPEQCWPWLGRTRPTGYGVFNVGSGSPIQATQIMLRAFVGEPPVPGAFALHSCDNPNCVNPAHLRWGDAKSNSDDREARGRSIKPKGEAHGHAKLTEDQVRRIRNGGGTGADMAREMGISETVVSLIRRGRIWRHVDG